MKSLNRTPWIARAVPLALSFIALALSATFATAAPLPSFAAGGSGREGGNGGSGDLIAFRRSAQRVRFLLEGPVKNTFPEGVRNAVIAKIESRDVRLKAQERVYSPTGGEIDAAAFPDSNRIVLGSARFRAMDQDERVILAFREYAELARAESKGGDAYTSRFAKELTTPWWSCEFLCGVRYKSQELLDFMASPWDHWPWVMQGNLPFEVIGGDTGNGHITIWHLPNHAVTVHGTTPAYAALNAAQACHDFLHLSETSVSDGWSPVILYSSESHGDAGEARWKPKIMHRKTQLAPSDVARNCKRLN